MQAPTPKPPPMFTDYACSHRHLIQRFFSKWCSTFWPKGDMTTFYLLNMRIMPWMRDRRLTALTPNLCHPPGGSLLKWCNECNQSHRDQQCRNYLILQGQQLPHHDIAQWHPLSSSPPSPWAWPSGCLVDRWMPVIIRGLIQNALHLLHQ